MQKKLIGVLLLSVFLAGCIHIPFGNGSGVQISKEGITLTDEEGNKHQVNLDEKEEQVSVTSTSQDGKEIEMTWGEGLDLPDAFPEDIPLPNDITVFQATDIDGSVSVGYGVEAIFDDISHLYQTFIESDTFLESNKIEGQDPNHNYVSYQGKRTDGSVTITVNNTAQEEEMIQVLIVYAKQETNTN